jgi:hypothetical protein
MASPKLKTDITATRDYYDILQNPSTHSTGVALKLTPKILDAQRHKIELEILADITLSEAQRKNELKKLHEAVMQIRRERKPEKAFAEQLRLEEAYDSSPDMVLNNPKKKSATVTPAPVPTSVLIDDVYNEYVLRAGAEPEVRSRFAEWVNSSVELAAAKFELFITKSTLQIRGPEVSPHKDKLALFLQQLMDEKYISKAQSVLSAYPNSSKTGVSMAGLGLFPKPTPGAAKRDANDKKQEEKSFCTPRTRPRNPGDA